ncbi:MAG: cell division protein FtsQ/DivIB [Gammaproteobacteria bacterium]
MKKQASRRQTQSAWWPLWWDWILRGALLALVVGLFVTLFDYLADPNNLPIQQVKVEGKLPHLDEADLQRRIDPYVKAGFIRLDVKALQHELSQEPWVSGVFIRRLWPDTVVVRIEEHQPLAHWGPDGLLSERGVVFFPSQVTLPDHLPYFNAPVGMEKKVLKTYNQMKNTLTPLPLTIQRLELSPRGAWILALENHMVIQLGRQDILRRLERFVKAYDKIIHSHHDDVKTVDLRYPNGIAVQWAKALP